MIHSLTSLRFLFAFLVFLNHSAFIFQSYPSQVWPFNYVFSKGGAGVCFFFIFSGFILTKAYSQRLLTNTTSWRAFMMKRLARIYPLHILSLLLYIPYHFIAIAEGGAELFSNEFAKSLLLNMTLLQSLNPDRDIYFAFNAPSWSLSVTMIFYVAFPGLIYFADKSKGVYLSLLLAFIGGLAISIYIANTSLDHYLFYINPAVRLLDFMAGITLYILIKDIKNNASFLTGTLVEIVAFASLMLFLIYHNIVSEGYRYSLYYWIPSLLIISVIYFQRGLLSQILSNRGFVFLGKISLSFYLLHWVILNYITLINHKFRITEDGLLLFMFSFLVILLCSSISYFFIEKPIVEKFRLIGQKMSRSNILVR